jgi:acyl-CoA thioester hydrolase
VKAHHIEPVRVDWEDTTGSGFMHFTAGLRYAERAEAGLRRRLGVLDDWPDYPSRGVVANCHVLPRFDDELEVHIGVDRIGRTSIRWRWEIRRGDEVCMDGQHTVVHVDRHEQPQEIPSSVRAVLEALTP